MPPGTMLGPVERMNADRELFAQAARASHISDEREKENHVCAF